MFKSGMWRSFRELTFRGALSLICCAIAALCVGSLLAALAENLRPKAPTTACKTINCVLKAGDTDLMKDKKRGASTH
jgi:hypothetical protein